MSAAQSKIRTSLTVDDPLVQDATYAFSPADRAFIDEQIRALQQAIVDGSGLSGVFGAWLTLDSGSAAVAVGDCVVSYSASSLSVTRATGGALAGAQFAYVVLRAAAPGARVFVATSGIVPSNVTGLAKTAGVVRVNTSTGRCERVASYSGGDVQVGQVSASGDLTAGGQGPQGAPGPDNVLKGKTVNSPLLAGQTYQGNGASIDAVGHEPVVNALSFGDGGLGTGTMLSGDPSASSAQATANRKAIQAAVDYAIAHGIGEVLLPVDPAHGALTKYVVDGPIFRVKPLRLRGQSTGGVSYVEISNAVYTACGPVFVDGADVQETVPTRVETYGSGSITTAQFVRSDPYGSAARSLWVSEMGGLMSDLNGTQNFCWQEFINPGNTPSGSTQWAIGGSRGRLDGTQINGFYITFDGSAGAGVPYAVSATFNTSVGAVTATTTTGMTSGVLNHVAVQFDNANIGGVGHLWIYINGVRAGVATFAAGATLVQGPNEEVAIGVYPSQSLTDILVFDPQGGYYAGGFRISKDEGILSHGGAIPYPNGTNFTPPTSVPAADGNTLLRIDLADTPVRSGWVKALAKSPAIGVQPAHLAWHGIRGALYVTYFEISHLRITSNDCAIRTFFVVDSHYHHLDIVANQGVVLDGFSYRNVVSECGFVEARTSYGRNFAVSCPYGGGQFNHIKNCSSEGYLWGYALADGGFLENLYHVPTGAGSTVHSQGYIYSGGSTPGNTVVRNCSLFDDNFATITVAGIYLFANPVAEVAGTFISTNEFSPGIPSVVVDSCDVVSIDGMIQPYAGAYCISFKQTYGAASNKAVRVNVSNDGVVHPLVDTSNPGLVVTPNMLAGSVTLNFASDADMVIGAGAPANQNDYYNRTLVFTDTAPHLTTGRNVVLPFNVAGYENFFVNQTAQALTIKGPSGTGFTIAAGNGAFGRADGTNVKRITADA